MCQVATVEVLGLELSNSSKLAFKCQLTLSESLKPRADQVYFVIELDIEY